MQIQQSSNSKNKSSKKISEEEQKKAAYAEYDILFDLSQKALNEKDMSQAEIATLQFEKNCIDDYLLEVSTLQE